MGNLVPVIFAIFIYFPTLVEVPVAQTFLSLGMHRGPLLAYLLSDPELSLQSVLVTGRIIGKNKTALYVILVAIFSTTAGLTLDDSWREHCYRRAYSSCFSIVTEAASRQRDPTRDLHGLEKAAWHDASRRNP